MHRSASPYRSTSPYYQPPPPDVLNYQRSYSPAPPQDETPAGPGDITYTVSTGPDGRPVYSLYKAVAASYKVNEDVFSGIQWVPTDKTTHLPPGARPADARFEASWRPGGGLSGDNQWRGDDRRRQGEAEAKRNRELEDDLRKARERDAQARERRNSFNASPQPPGAGYTFPTSGSGSQYSRSPYSGYTAGGDHSELDRKMGDLDVRDRGSTYPAEKVSTHAPRPRKYSTNEPIDVPRSISPHPGVRQDGRATAGPYGASTASGAYNTGRPYSSAGHHPSSSISSTGRVSPMPFVPPAPTGAPYNSYSTSPNRAPDPISRSTTPFGGPPGGTSVVYPRGHVMEGQPILPQDRARMSPMPQGPPPLGPYSSSTVGMTHAGSSPNIPPAHSPASRQLAAPEGFSRPVNGSHPFTPFDIMKIQDMEKFWFELPRMPPVLNAHDVLDPDWLRLMTVFEFIIQDWDITLAWAGKLPIPEPEPGVPPSSRSTIIIDLIELWNESFFWTRGAELVLVRGRQRLTGHQKERIESDLPYFDEPDDYISSEEEQSDNPDSDLEYGGGRYQHYGDPHQQLTEVFAEGRRRTEAKRAREAERRKRRKERHRKRREAIRARKYALYLTYVVPMHLRRGGYPSNAGYPSGGSYGGGHGHY
ncbi:hypothetical protein H0H87_011753 [Tephrocybe sp. NHM501043]|nr:hypothetical protein H0H87_011753 [Tephrocybe sp. NHM501043]